MKINTIYSAAIGALNTMRQAFCQGRKYYEEVIVSMVHPVKLGRNTRMSYGKIREVIDMPNLIEIQKNSYDWFLNEGLKEVFHDVSPITDYTGNLIL